MFGAVDQPRTLPRWAVIKDARRRQRRRRQRIRASVAVLVLAAAGGSLINHDTRPAPTATSAAIAGPVEPLRLGGSVLDTTTLQRNLWVLTCVRGCSQPWSRAFRGQLIELTSVGLAIKRFPVADPGAIAGGAGAIWLAHFNSGEVSRIDPQTGRATARIRLRLPKPITPGADRHFIGSAISVSGDRVWVSTARGWTAEIDPHTVGLVRMAYSSSEATSASTAGGVTWVADELAGVGTFTAASTRVTSRKITWAGQPLSIDTVDHGAGLIWTMGSGNLLTAGHQAVTIVTTIDPYTRQIEHQWQVPDTAAMVVSGDSAYVGDGKGGQIVRLTPPDHVQILHGPNAASLEAVTPHELWATTPTGELLRIALAPGGA